MNVAVLQVRATKSAQDITDGAAVEERWKTINESLLTLEDYFYALET